MGNCFDGCVIMDMASLKRALFMDRISVLNGWNMKRQSGGLVVIVLL